MSSVEEGVEIAVRPRQPSEDGSKIPTFRGRAFIANVRPIEILACIHLLSYRLIWDTRMSSGRILQRYGYYDFLFYVVYRGIAQIYLPRDAAGIQDVRCWSKDGKLSKNAFPETEKIDIVYRSVEAPEVPLQEGKVRMHINLGAYRIEWMENLQGCNVTWVGDADIAATVPTSIWKVFSKEFPKTVVRLRDAMEQFGIPPFVLDVEDCVVIQTTFFYSQDRRTAMRHHVRKAGSYVIRFDRRKMFPFGIDVPIIEGDGAHAVQYQQDEDRLTITLGKEGIGKEYVIVSGLDTFHKIIGANTPLSHRPSLLKMPNHSQSH